MDAADAVHDQVIQERATWGFLSGGLGSALFLIFLFRMTTPSVEPPRTTSVSKKQPVRASAKVSPSSPVSCTWSTTKSMTETVELAKTLWREMHMWFLNFVNEALDVGFHLIQDQNIVSWTESGRLQRIRQPKRR
jgi:hypothetical protein